MNSCIVFIALFAVALSAPTDHVPKSIKDIHDECQAEPATHIDESAMEKLSKGEDVKDKNIGAHVLCMNVKLGVQTKNGDIELESLRKLLSHLIHNEESLNKVMTKVGVRAHETTPEEAALHLFKETAKAIAAQRALSALTDHVPKAIKEIHDECQAEPATHIDESAMEKLSKGEDVKDKNIGAHVLCMNVKLGVQKKNGDIEVESLRKLLSHLIHDEESLNKVMTKVGVRAHETTPEEAALHLFKETAKCIAAQRTHGHTNVQEIHDECQAETSSHVDESSMGKLVRGELVEDQNIGAHALCMNVGLGIQKKNGDIEVESLRKHLSHLIHDEEKLNKVMSTLGVKSHGSTPEEAAITLFQGVAKNVPDKTHKHLEEHKH